MQQCPNCKKETKEMLAQKPGGDADSLDLVCLSCGAVKPTDNVESKFKEKSEVRSTNKEGKWDSEVQTASKSIADYGGTKMGTKDADGKPIKPGNWGRLRVLNTRSDRSRLDHLKRDHNELFNELIRRIIPVQQKMLQEKTLLPLYLKCLELKVNRGRDTELIMIGIIYIYLHKENIPWKGNTTKWKYIFNQTGRKKKEILSIVNIIMRTLDWEIDKKGSTYGFYPKSYDEIDRIIKKIKEDDNSFRNLKISKRAREIIDKVSNDGLTGGILPKNQAGAAYFTLAKPIMGDEDRKNYEEALKCFEKATNLINTMEVGAGVISYVVEQKPFLATIKIFFHKGLTFLILKQPDKALECFEKVLDLDPEDPNAWYVKSQALQELEREKESNECFEHALELGFLPGKEFLYKENPDELSEEEIRKFQDNEERKDDDEFKKEKS